MRGARTCLLRAMCGDVSATRVTISIQSINKSYQLARSIPRLVIVQYVYVIGFCDIKKNLVLNLSKSKYQLVFYNILLHIIETLVTYRLDIM